MKVNLGGERIGTGARIQVDLKNFKRSTFNQSREWRSTMGVGMGVPCFKEIGLTGTTFEMHINTAGYTIPTIAPLFGEFKLQVDMYACPIRLYQGFLHNNNTNIGLEMNKVLLPKINIPERGRTSTSSLLNYLGIKGATNQKHEFDALRILAYWDIFKNYYSNKQEENAKVINWNVNPNEQNFKQLSYTTNQGETILNVFEENVNNNLDFSRENVQLIGGSKITILGNKNWGQIQMLTINTTENSFGINPDFQPNGEPDTTNGGITIIDYSTNIQVGNLRVEDKQIIIQMFQSPAQEFGEITNITFINSVKGIDITDFPLSNLDDAREKILSKSKKLDRIILNTDLNFLPYNINFPQAGNNSEMYEREMNGLFLKTYLSDIYNNWLSNEKVKLINDISSVNIEVDENGTATMSMDTFLMSKKVYNLLNRVAASGGTYEDWQESVYGEKVITRAESPIYIGGTSALIQFQEVVSTAATIEEPLGSLGGRGIMTKRKGGHIVFKCEEPCIILGIASITPKVDYYQGNDWFVTEIDNMDNFHKPELDGIGFQNLIANQIVWSASTEDALAKTTAWINYQTSVNEVFGYFAEPESEDKYKSLGHMVLRRDFETDENGDITDFTTYIDPEKYNKVFAGQDLANQNFWIQIGFNVQSRRKMAAYEIPML